MFQRIISEEIAIFTDSYIEGLLFNNLLNESIGWGDITSLIKKIVNKKRTLQNALIKFATSTNISMKKALIMVILALISFESGVYSIPKVDNTTIEQLAKKSSLNNQDLNDLMNVVKKGQSDAMEYQIQTMRISNEGIDFIKKHEGLSLTPYKLGDGMITIGYGHAEPIVKSKYRYKMNQQISVAEAERLLKDDLQKIEVGLKNVLQKLRKEGIVFEITQNMYDAMVSMAFNMGPYGLETSNFIRELRDTKDPVKAAEKIKTSRVSKFRGLPIRRQAEYELFTRDLQMPV